MTRAIILAAGQGTRLRPLTNDRPKCLVPLLGIPLLTRQARVLEAGGVSEIRVVAGYRADQIQQHPYECSIAPRYETTNMVETLFAAEEHLDGIDDLLICYGDIVYQQENLTTVLAGKAEITLMIDKEWKRYWALRLEDPLSDAETLVMDADKNILELGKKPQDYSRIQGQYTGLIKIRADKIQDFIAFYHGLDRTKTYDGQPFEKMYMTSFLQLLIDAGWEVKAAEVSNGWLEVDSVDDLTQYEAMAARGELDSFYKAEA